MVSIRKFKISHTESDALIPQLESILSTRAFHHQRVETLIENEISLVFGQIGDYTHRLSSKQTQFISKAVTKRQLEYSTGRFFTLLAQKLLGRYPAPVETLNRCPIWPDGLLGSISHTDQFAIVVMALNTRYKGLGVDMEIMGKVTNDISSLCLTPFELKNLPQSDKMPYPETMIFSGKEAVYKAVNPLIGHIIEFNEVELDFNQNHFGHFSARYIGSDTKNQLINEGAGWCEFFGNHVLTTYVIPHK